MQKHEVINLIMNQYAKRTPITRKGISCLYDRAQARGYKASEIYTGLKTVICKNYLRAEYRFPGNDPTMEVIDERRYIEDFEFRELMKDSVATSQQSRSVG